MVIREERRLGVTRTELSKISKYRTVLEKSWAKSTVVMLPPAAGVLLFEVCVSWMWAF